MPLPTEPLCLLNVHAHPDDEASKGAATVARYCGEGIRNVLVCCTGGEEGEILNPAMDRPEVVERLAEVRREELAESAKVIGYDEVIMLGYRDSGMPDSEANARPEAFANAPIDESVGRLVAIIRRAKPQVIVTYNDDQAGYPHPDHLMVHDISVLAFDRAGDPAWYPEHGEPYTPAKLYYSAWSMTRMRKIHEKMLELKGESPFDEKWFSRPSHDDRITTSVDISTHAFVRRQALLAHATQIDPLSPFWFGLPDDIADGIHPHDDYILAQSRVETTTPEHDLFAGLR